MSSAPLTISSSKVYPIVFQNKENLTGVYSTLDNLILVSSSYIGTGFNVVDNTSGSLPITGYRIDTIPQQTLETRFQGSFSGLYASASNAGIGASITCSAYVLKTQFPQTVNANGQLVIDPRSIIAGVDAATGSGEICAEQVLAQDSSGQLDNTHGTFTARSVPFISASLNDFFFPCIACTQGDFASMGPDQKFQNIFTASAFTLPSSSSPTVNTIFYITSSNNYMGASRPTSNIIIEPSFDSPFTNQPCDVLMNNAVTERPNPFLQDLDYTTSATRPVNFQAIKDNSATRATVPESFYTQLSSTNPRYTGAKLETSNFNIGSNISSQYMGGVYAAYYIKASNTGNTVAGITGRKGTFMLQYIINPDGTLYQLSNSEKDKEFIERLFTPVRRLFDKVPSTTSGYINSNRAMKIFGDPAFSHWVRIIDYYLISNPESADISPLGARGTATVKASQGGVELILYNTGSSRDPNDNGVFPVTPQGKLGGIIYPANIQFTNSSDLPNRIGQILFDNGIIPSEVNVAQ